MSHRSSSRIADGVGVASVAFIEIAVAVSLAALIVRDAAPEALPRLMGALLIGTAIAAALVGIRSSLPGTVSTVQDTPVVVIAAVAAALVADVAPEAHAATLLVFVGLSGLLTGVVILFIGVARMGEVVRYLPTPVVDGFRLGTGWLLLIGGFEVAAGESLTLNGFEGVAAWSVGLAVVVAIGIAASDAVDLPPAALSFAIASTAAVFLIAGSVVSSIDDLLADGWMLGPLESDPQWRPLLGDLGDADWGAILSQTPALAAVAFISVTGLLLNISAIEVEIDRDAEIDVDLRSTGLANVLIGAGGSSPAYIMFSGTMLAQRLGLKRRRTSGFVGATVLLVFVLGAGVAGYTPRFLTGGLLAGLGLGLGFGWLRERDGRPTSDAVLALVVATVIGAIGVLEGVGLGVVLAAVIFVRRYSLIDPVRRSWRGTSSLSRIDRDAATASVLRARDDESVVLELEGYLFFGSAARIRRTIRGLVDDDVTHLVLDFSSVSGIDGSAQTQLRHLIRRLERQRVVVWTSGRPADGLLPDATRHGLDLDRAIESVEQRLAGSGPTLSVLSDDPLVALLGQTKSEPASAGTDLFIPGEESDGFVVVRSGAVSVWLDRDDAEPVRLRQVGPGGLLGELGFATGEPRTARATCDVDCELWRVAESDLADADEAFVSELRRLVLARVATRLTITNEIVRNLSR